MIKEKTILTEKATCYTSTTILAWLMTKFSRIEEVKIGIGLQDGVRNLIKNSINSPVSQV